MVKLNIEIQLETKSKTPNLVSKPKIYQSRVLPNVLELHITMKKIKIQKYITKMTKLATKEKRETMKVNLGTQ